MHHLIGVLGKAEVSEYSLGQLRLRPVMAETCYFTFFMDAFLKCFHTLLSYMGVFVHHVLAP